MIPRLIISGMRKGSLGFGVALLIVATVGGLSLLSLDRLMKTAEARRAAYERLRRWEEVFSLLKDAETGQRGFLLTGDEAYLAPFTSAQAQVPGKIQELFDLRSSEPESGDQMETIRRLAD